MYEYIKTNTDNYFKCTYLVITTTAENIPQEYSYTIKSLWTYITKNVLFLIAVYHFPNFVYFYWEIQQIKQFLGINPNIWSCRNK